MGGHYPPAGDETSSLQILSNMFRVLQRLIPFGYSLSGRVFRYSDGDMEKYRLNTLEKWARS